MRYFFTCDNLRSFLFGKVKAGFDKGLSPGGVWCPFGKHACNGRGKFAMIGYQKRLRRIVDEREDHAGSRFKSYP